MSSRRRGSLLVALTVLSLVVLPACGSAPGEGGRQVSGDAADKAAASRVVVVSPQEPKTLLPHFDLLDAAFEVQHLAFDCLYDVDAKGNYVPRLASEVPTPENGLVSDGGRTYTVPLRAGVKWQDGQPFTSADVLYTWQVVMDPKLPIPSRSGWDQIQSIDTPDDHTVVFHFAQPNATLLQTLATGACFILPEHVLKGTDLVASSQNRKPVGDGPYTVAEWQAGSFIRLEANPNYWQKGKPKVREIIYKIVPSTEGMRAALQRGDAQVQLYPSVADLSFIRQLPDYRLAEVPSFSWWQFWLNNSKPALSDVRVRQALEYAIDKQAIANSVFQGLVKPMWAALPPNHWAHNPDVPTFPYDPDKAKQLLDEAGWKVGPDGVRTKGGQRLSLDILNIAGEQERLQVVQIVQKYWQQVGVDVKIRQIDAASFPPTMAKGDWDVAYGRFGDDLEPTFSLWLGTNWQRYGNQRALDLARQALAAVDRDQRRQLIQQFQTMVAQDVPVIFIVPQVTYTAYHKNLKGFGPTLSGNLWNAAEWQWP